MKSIYAKSSLFLLLVSMTVPLSAEMKVDLEFALGKEKGSALRKLYEESKSMDITTFQKHINNAKLTDGELQGLFNASVEQEKEILDFDDKIIFLAAKVSEKLAGFLRWAYEKNDKQMIKVLRAIGYDVSQALDQAVDRKIFDIIPALLKDGAQPSIEYIRIAIRESGFKNGQNQKKWLAILPKMLKNVKNINQRDEDGFTLLDHTNDKEVVAILLRAGVDVNAQNNDGNTYLLSLVPSLADARQEREDWARNYMELITYLVEQGANPNLTNKKGESALSMAKKLNLPDVVTLFEGSKSSRKRRLK